MSRPDDLTQRLSRLETAQRRLKAAVAALLGVISVVGIGGYISGVVHAQEEQPAGPITTSRINVVDAEGTVRLRIGSDLPDGVIGGKVRPRGHKFSGVLIYDEEGQERSGYGTMGGGNVGLTLDTKTLQSAFFVAGPSGGAALRIWNGDDAVDLRVDENGPSLHATKGGQVAFHEPVIEQPVSAPFFRSLHEAASRVSKDRLLQACRARRAERSCRACLSDLQ